MEIILIILVLILAGVAVSKILQAKELVDGLKGDNAEPITDAEMKTNALGLVVYGAVLFAFLIAQIIGWEKYMLPSSASVHGVETDGLMEITMVLILSVFFITHILLFWFGFKFYYRKGRKAFWFPHNNALEMAWTVVPAVVLIMLISYGMSTWGSIMNPEEEPDLNIEFVSEQFKWTTRYAGDDGKLGSASFALYGSNAVGVATEKAIIKRLEECKKMITDSGSLEEFYKKEFKVPHVALRNSLKNYEEINEKGDTIIMFKGLRADSAVNELLIANDWNKDGVLDNVEASLRNYKANIIRLNRMLEDYGKYPAKYDAGKDDVVINGNSIKLPKGKKIKLQFRSKDVIHSAYFPHFRAQMNAVPGMKTYFSFEPKETSTEFNQKAIEEGRVYMKRVKDEEGNVISAEETLGSTGFILYCNKICGASHYNMKVYIEVVEEEEFEDWLADQAKFEVD
jgi:cytochrome c oxidase subunit 2